MKIVPTVIVKKLFLQGKVVTVNQEIDYDTAEEIAMEFEVLCEKEEVVDVIEELLKEEEEDENMMVKRLSSEYRLSASPFDMFHNLFVWGANHNKGKLCEAGRYSIFIDPYANVYPCLPYGLECPIKNLRETKYIIGDISKEAKRLYERCKLS